MAAWRVHDARVIAGLEVFAIVTGQNTSLASTRDWLPLWSSLLRHRGDADHDERDLAALAPDQLFLNGKIPQRCERIVARESENGPRAHFRLPSGAQRVMNQGRAKRKKGTITRMNDTQSTATATNATGGAQGAAVAPAKASSKKKSTAKAVAPQAPKTAKKAAPKRQAKAAAKPKASSAAGRANSKKTAVLDMLRRKNGATMNEIAEATSWQNHSIRGFISGTVSKCMGLTIESTRDENGDRRYRIAGK